MPAASGVREMVAFEPVFQGEVYLSEAGREHPLSVVLVHGVGDEASRIWEGLVPELARHYHVVSFDLPGFGRSARQNLHYSQPLYTAFLKWIVDRYVRGSFVLIGHSMGGAICLRFAATYPRGLERMILVDVAGVLHRAAFAKYLARMQIDHTLLGTATGPGRILSRVTDFMVEKVQGLTVDVELALSSAGTRKKWLEADPNRIAALSLAESDLSRLIELARACTLIIWGRGDEIAPVRTGRVLAANLPHARLELIREAGHCPMLDQPKVFNKLVIDELQAEPHPVTIQGGSPAARAGRIGRCKDQRDLFLLTGEYDLVDIVDCRRVRLKDLRATRIEISGSTVEMQNVSVRGEAVALLVRGSVVFGTVGRLEADVAIQAEQSRLDLAGVELVGRDAALRGSDSRVLFSVSRVQSPYTRGHLHGLVNISPETPR